MKGWKTVTFNVANAVVFAADAVTASFDIPDEYKGPWIAGLLIANIVLRLMTTTPVGQGE